MGTFIIPFSSGLSVFLAFETLFLVFLNPSVFLLLSTLTTKEEINDTFLSFFPYEMTC